MPGFLFDDDAAQERGQRFQSYVDEQRRKAEQLTRQAQSIAQPVAPAVSNAGQQFMDYVNQRRQELQPQAAAVAQPIQDAGQQFMDYVNQQRAAQPAPAAVAEPAPAVATPGAAPALPHAEEPATASDDLGKGWKTQFDFGATYTGDYRHGTPHRGVDLTPSNGGGIGTTVTAFTPGTVTNISRDSGAGGLMMYVQDDQGLTHAYMHLANTNPNIHVGDTVSRGMPIAQMGESGTEGSPHLHYEVRKNAASGDPLDKLIDPRPYLQGANQGRSVAGAARVAAGGEMPETRLDTSSPEAFIRSITPAATYVAARTGIPAAAMIGMAANETGYGKFADGNNLFGIKGQGPAGSINAQTWEDYGAGPVTIRDAFRAYDNVAQSFQDFADLITQAPRYAAAKGQQTVEGFVQALKDGGYMTDPNYVGKIKSIVDRYAPVINDAGAAADALGTRVREITDQTVNQGRALVDEAGRRVSSSEQMLRDMQTSAEARTRQQQSEAETRRLMLQTQFEDTRDRVKQQGQDLMADVMRPRSFDNPLDQFQAGFRSPQTRRGGLPTPSDDLTNPIQSQYNAPSAPFEFGKNLALAGESAVGAVRGAGSELGKQLQGITPGSTMTPEEAVRDPIRAINEYGQLTQTGSGIVPAVQHAAAAVARGRYDDAIGEVVRRTSPGLGLLAETDVGGVVSAGLKGGGMVGARPLAGVELADWAGLLTNLLIPGPELKGLGQYVKPILGPGARILSSGLADWARSPLGQAFKEVPGRFQRGAQEWANAPIGQIAKEIMQGPVARFLVDESGELDVDRLVEVASAFKQRAQDMVRMYHGGASSFDRADLGRDAGQNLYGPGFYTTSDPQVAGGIVSEPGRLRPPEIQQQIDDAMRRGDKREATMLRTQYPHERGGEVQAPGYAQQRQPTQFRDAEELGRQVDDLKARQKGWTDLAAKHPDNPGVAEGAQIEIDKHQASIDELERRISGLAADVPAGPNVRAIDVPRNLPLFDMDAPVDPDKLDAIGQAVGDVLGDPEDARSFVTNVRTQIPARDLDGRRTWNALVEYMRTFARSAPGSNYDATPQAQANQVLEQMGYQGIKHTGGRVGHGPD